VDDSFWNNAFLSDLFLIWLDRAGWVSSGFDAQPGAFDDQGDCAIWEKGGDGKAVTGYILHADDSGSISAKADPDSKPFLTDCTLDVVERYFWGLRGEVVRKKSGLAALAEPSAPAPDYRLADGALVDRAGKTVAKGEPDSLVFLSHYLAAPLDQIQTSFLSPDGKPLFAVRD
jgi:hypothetical protein